MAADNGPAEGFCPVCGEHHPAVVVCPDTFGRMVVVAVCVIALLLFAASILVYGVSRGVS